MPKISLTHGAFRLPEGYLRSRRLGQSLECWLDHRDGAIILLPRLPDLHKLYIEPTTVCNLNCRFRNQVSAFYFPSCPDCDLRETCDLRERNEGCWGWNPSCADCLWAQEIVHCP